MELENRSRGLLLDHVAPTPANRGLETGRPLKRYFGGDGWKSKNHRNVIRALKFILRGIYAPLGELSGSSRGCPGGLLVRLLQEVPFIIENVLFSIGLISKTHIK